MPSPFDYLDDVLLAFVAILPVVNPFSKPPIFLSITEGWTLAERKSEALKACIYAFIILVVSLVAGTFILEFLPSRCRPCKSPAVYSSPALPSRCSTPSGSITKPTQNIVMPANAKTSPSCRSPCRC